MGVEMLRFPSALLGFLPFLLIGMFREGDGGLEVFWLLPGYCIPFHLEFRFKFKSKILSLVINDAVYVWIQHNTKAQTYKHHLAQPKLGKSLSSMIALLSLYTFCPLLFFPLFFFSSFFIIFFIYSSSSSDDSTAFLMKIGWGRSGVIRSLLCWILLRLYFFSFFCFWIPYLISSYNPCLQYTSGYCFYLLKRLRVASNKFGLSRSLMVM